MSFLAIIFAIGQLIAWLIQLVEWVVAKVRSMYSNCMNERVRQRVLRHIQKNFRGREFALFAAKGRTYMEALRDAHDRAVPGLEDVAGEAWLFFADFSPLSNWSHECAYIVVRDHGEPVIAHHRWPPNDAVRLLPVSISRDVRATSKEPR